MKKYNFKVVLVDGADRQTLPLAKEFRKLGGYVVTLNSSRLDNGYVSRYPNKKILREEIYDNKKNIWK